MAGVSTFSSSAAAALGNGNGNTNSTTDPNWVVTLPLNGGVTSPQNGSCSGLLPPASNPGPVTVSGVLSSSSVTYTVTFPATAPSPNWDVQFCEFVAGNQFDREDAEGTLAGVPGRYADGSPNESVVVVHYFDTATLTGQLCVVVKATASPSAPGENRKAGCVNPAVTNPPGTNPPGTN